MLTMQRRPTNLGFYATQYAHKIGPINNERFTLGLVLPSRFPLQPESHQGCIAYLVELADPF